MENVTLDTLTTLASTISLGLSATTLVFSLAAAVLGGLAGVLTFGEWGAGS